MPASSGAAPRNAHALGTTILLAVAHAACLVAAFPPIDTWPMAFIAPALLAWLGLRATSARRAFAITAPCQFIMWLWLQRWLIDVSAPGYLALCLYLSAYTLLTVWIIRRCERHPALSRWPMTFLLPVVWIGVEYFRGALAFDGYPWFLIAHPLVSWPTLAQSADLLGTYFVGFVCVACSGAIVDAVRLRESALSRRLMLVSAIAAALLLVANVAYGLVRTAQAESGVLAPGPRLLAIQTNLPQDNKIGWTLEQQQRDIPHFMELTRRSLAQHGPVDLIIWPETMLPGFGLEPDAISLLEAGGYVAAKYPRAIAALAQELETPMLIGSPAFIGLRIVDSKPSWAAQYNSAYLVAAAPPYQRYDKCFLTPFGETMPYISHWPWLEQKLLAVGAQGMKFDLDRNPDIQLLHVGTRNDDLPESRSSIVNHQAPVSLATPICFEDTVPWVCRMMVYEAGHKRAHALVNLSNDGWFGAHDAGREQHVQIARFRCIENRVPMVRCANTGMSVWIDSTGRIAGRVGPGRYGTGQVEGALVADLQLDSRRTLYGRIGDAWAWLCLGLTLLAVLRTMWPTSKVNPS